MERVIDDHILKSGGKKPAVPEGASPIRVGLGVIRWRMPLDLVRARAPFHKKLEMREGAERAGE